MNSQFIDSTDSGSTFNVLDPQQWRKTFQIQLYDKDPAGSGSATQVHSLHAYQPAAVPPHRRSVSRPEW